MQKATKSLSPLPVLKIATYALLIAITFPSYAQDTIYVDSDAVGNNNGTSWEDAFTSLQDARDAALIAGGAEIWVAEGVYYPDSGMSQVPGDRSATFQVTSGLKFYGGFIGGETNLEQRSWQEAITTLSGDIGTMGVSSDNSYHVVTTSGSDVTAILDGFRIQHGFADGSDNTANGAGIFNIGGSPTIRNVIVSNNFADDNGGGMYNLDSEVSIVNAIYNDNEVKGNGGALYNEGGAPEIYNSRFERNIAFLVVSRGSGGAIYNTDSNVKIVNSVFIDNLSGNRGGAVRSRLSNLIIDTGFFYGNEAQLGGGLATDSDSTLVFNSFFSGNTASTKGGAIENRERVRIVNSTISGNFGDNGAGGVSTEFDDIAIIQNSIISGNTSNSDEKELTVGTNGELVISSSLIKGGLPLDVTDGGNNVIGTPIFVDFDGNDDEVGTEDDDLRLGPGSLGVDMGNNSYLDLNGNGTSTDDITLDAFGFKRIYDSNADGNAVVDMGAFESPLPPPTNLTSDPGDTEVLLSWIGVNGQAIAGYNIYRDTSPEPNTISNSVNADTDIFTDTGLTNYTNYYYRVAAVDGDGIAGRFSNEISALPIDLTPPLTPSGFEAIAGDSLVSLIWNANEEGDLANYLIVRDTTAEPTEQVAEIEAGQEAFDDINLPNNVTYYYRIAAADTAGNVSDFSDVINAIPIGTAFLQFVHNSPDAPALQVSVSGEQIVDSLSYTNATDFIELRSIEVDLLITYDPGDGSTEIVLDSTITLVDEKAYVFVANGLIGSDGDDAFELVLNENARYKATTPESVDFFVFHGSPDALTVEINLLDSTPDHNQITVLANELSLGEFTTYRSVDADFYNVEIVSSLTGQQVEVYALDVSTLAGSSVTVVVGGYLQSDAEEQPFGVFIYAGEVEPILAPVVTHSDEESSLPTELVVRGSYPNPFQVNATLSFDIPQTTEVHVELYDMLGRRVFSTERTQFTAGSNHSIKVNGDGLAAGIYIYKLFMDTSDTPTVKTGQVIKIR